MAQVFCSNIDLGEFSSLVSILVLALARSFLGLQLTVGDVNPWICAHLKRRILALEQVERWLLALLT